MAEDRELIRLTEEAEALGIDINELNESTSPMLDSTFTPSSTLKDNIFRFFREILSLTDTTKFGNLRNEELGSVRMGVRHYKNIALFADKQGLKIVADYLRQKSEIITSTSMSRKGWFGNLTVTQIKKEQKIKDAPPEKKGWFTSSKPKEAQDE